MNFVKNLKAILVKLLEIEILSMVTCTKCISDIFKENEFNIGIDAHPCRLSANIDKRARWFIISLQRQHTNVSYQ